MIFWDFFFVVSWILQTCTGLRGYVHLVKFIYLFIFPPPIKFPENHDHWQELWRWGTINKFLREPCSVWAISVTRFALWGQGLCHTHPFSGWQNLSGTWPTCRVSQAAGLGHSTCDSCSVLSTFGTFWRRGWWWVRRVSLCSFLLWRERISCKLTPPIDFYAASFY